ncbi:MAG: Regulatory protein LysR:LysR, substrate-binding [Paucimonas sp.]|nr:Regulatory protein LysR:LysR, substrate-binding [Paucimonas sp.]
MRLDLYSLKLFVAVVDKGSISGASESEHIACSAVSKRITELEKSVGVPLFRRVPRGVEPTVAGRSLAARARAILHNADHLVDEIREFSEGSRGHIRLAANLSAITQFLPAELRAFRQSHPRIDVELEEKISSAVIKAVQENAADLGICSADSGLAHGLERYPYRDDSLVLLVPEFHPLAKRKSVFFAEALQYEVVGMHKGSSINALLMKAAAEARAPLQIRFFATAFDSMVAMVKGGLGIGVLPLGVMNRLYRMDGLQTVRLGDAWAQRQLSICLPSKGDLAPCVVHLLEHLLAQAAAIEAGQASAARLKVATV